MPPSRLRVAAPAAKAQQAYEEGDRLAAAGDAAGAQAAYRRALAARPGFAEAWNNLGNALMMAGRFAEAEDCYKATLAHGLDHALVRYNLAGARKKLGLAAAAMAGLRQALALRPDYAEAWNNLANLWRDDKAPAAACRGYLRALRLKPAWEEAHDNLSAALYLLSEAGEPAAAAALAQDWRAAHPDHPLARHLGAALAGETGDVRAADAYVRQVFDAFAADFDERLAELQYQAPALLAAALRAAGIGGDEAKKLTVLDAGCGTGLCGPLLQGWARRLDGVDLSPEMLARAAGRGVYDDLRAAELTAFLQDNPGRYDLIVAADVFCYFGALGEALRAAAAALSPGGVLAFSVERRGAAPEGAAGYLLQAHGRYAHGEAGLRADLLAAGLQTLSWDVATLRSESGKPVVGFVIVARAG
jgi:predicted TPR repeat methyltransferase